MTGSAVIREAGRELSREMQDIAREHQSGLDALAKSYKILGRNAERSDIAAAVREWGRDAHHPIVAKLLADVADRIAGGYYLRTGE